MLRERQDHTLETTALINEAYLRLLHAQKVEWQNRDHFLAVSARLMRRVLVDFARARKAEKRGGNAERIPVSDDLIGREGRSVDLVSLDQILNDLSKIDERKSRVVELRFFGGLGVRQTAAVLGISPATVMRDWDFAKAWILRQMEGS
jgi:RNA polymerase sigma factor (TIGR02999 family)